MTAPVPFTGRWDRAAGGPLVERVDQMRQLGHLTDYGAVELTALLQPAGRAKYLYRVTATWKHAPTRDGQQPADTVRVWHYQSKAAADHRAAVLREGLPERPGDGHPEDPGVAAVPPAFSVVIERSERVLWTTAPAAVPAPAADGGTSPQERAARAAGVPSPVPEDVRAVS